MPPPALVYSFHKPQGMPRQLFAIPFLEHAVKVSQPKVSLNTEAEITVMEGKLFRKVTSANCLKKRDF